MTGPEVTQPDPDGGVEMTDAEWAAFRGVEVTAAMKAEDVPKALVERMAAAICPNSRPEHKGVTYCIGCFKRAGEALAAVLPEIQAQAGAHMADLTARIGFGDGVTEPQADNDTIVKAVNEAFTNSNTLWEVEEQVERVRALADHYEARQGTGLGRVSTGNAAASIRRALGPQEVQIATQEPAEQPRTDSAGRGASGGLGERLRALVAEPDPEESQYESVDVAALVGLADEAHRLEVHARVVERSLRTSRLEGDGARIKGEQWKARYEETRDANRRVLGVAQWFRGQGQTGYARKVEEAVGTDG